MSDTLFNRHLDECSHCERHPFDLCEHGLAILRESVFENVHRAEERERCEEVSEQ